MSTFAPTPAPTSGTASAPTSAPTSATTSAATLAANRTDYQFRLAGDTDAPSFRVLRFEGDECLSKLFCFRVKLGVSLREIEQGDALDTESYLGQTASVQTRGRQRARSSADAKHPGN